MQNYLEFKKKYEKVVISAKREIEEIELIAVSKKKPIDLIENVIIDGCKSFGENQLQELEKKWIPLKEKFPDIKTHFIGGIQSKKTKSIFQLCNTIHSIDRFKIVKQIKDLEEELRLQKEYFIQINTGDEEQKFGVSFVEAEKFIDTCMKKYGLNVKGLMCLPPQDEDPKPHFLKLRDLGKNFKLPFLSMGMSGDYEIALECGSTHIRIGSLIFGKRD